MGEPTDRLEQEYRRIDEADMSDGTREAILEAVGDVGTATTKFGYLSALRRAAVATDDELHALGPDEMNDVLQTMADERGWSEGTLQQSQSALKAFAEEVGHDRDEIDMVTTSHESPDPRSILGEEEFHELREATTSTMDKALIDFLGYTGQRIRVAQALTVDDIDADAGVWYMPDADEGLKGADKTGTKRPLLGARKSMGEWMEQHWTGDADDAVFTPAPSSTNAETGDEMGQSSIRRRIEKVADRAGIEKDTNPHAFRHHFVTVASKRYDMDDATIRHLIGHGEGSRIMSTTYRHLGDDYHIEAAEEAFGIREEDQQRRAPPVCSSCNRPLRPECRECPTAGCTELFGVDDPETELEQLAVEIEEKVARFEELKGEVRG